MAAALPFVDEFVEGHSLNALEELANIIGGAQDRRIGNTVVSQRPQRKGRHERVA